MPTTRFDLTHPPFDLLTLAEASALSASADILYFSDEQEILASGSPVDALYLVMKGLVREMSGEDVVGAYREHETFDCRALATGKTAHRYVAHEEVLLCVFPGREVLALTEKNSLFGAYFFATVSDKLGQLAQSRDRREWQSLFAVKISDAGFRAPIFADGDETIAQAARRMEENRRRSIFVRHGYQTGIFTTGDFCQIVANGISNQTPLRQFARFSLLCCEKDDYLFNALLLMTRHNIHRIVVTDKGQPVGVLALIDLLSYFSNHSLSIARQLEAATTFDHLRAAMLDMESLVTTLVTQGIKTPQLARLVQVLNTQLMARLWQMVATPAVFAGSSLLALGSEGRGEQILKTDQDNALILAEGLNEKEVEQSAESFTHHMLQLGYPPCPGGMMVNQPLWRHTVRQWGHTLHGWANSTQGEGLMHLAIFLDAETVSGPASWLAACRQALRGVLPDDAAWYSRMALPIEQFPTRKVETGFWRQLLNREKNALLDIKKAGIFPIVHGARVLALEAGIDAPNTFDRLEALTSRSILEKSFADDVAESLAFLMRLRLDAGLEMVRRGTPLNNEVDTATLSTLEKDLLQDALEVVRRFKRLVGQRYGLDRF
ncbi:putative nucleotidyltransferase substrate binding domain-containing protein [Desulfovibrio sp.]|uniref:putative nucleotidyltransferase substrate binding domain-containing protein n=1 Tax=Desulfovibrio sp. TaxID=885 RepID=UPI0025C3D8F8|nr:putative nucleotidyltransferase substrate binding domain-containing protein [Desulfovibrio sp.]